MNKRKYVRALSTKLGRLSEIERESAVQYYSEIIDDMLDERKDWDYIVSHVGSPADAAKSILRGDTEKRRGREEEYVAPQNRGYAAPPTQINVYNVPPPNQPQYGAQPQYGEPPHNGQSEAPRYQYAPQYTAPPRPVHAENNKKGLSGFWLWYLIFGIVTIPLTIGLLGGLIGLLAGLLGIMVAGFSLAVAGPIVIIMSVVYGIMAQSPLVFFSMVSAGLLLTAIGLVTIYLARVLFTPIKMILKRRKA